MMEHVVIPLHNRSPIDFVGEEIAFVTTHRSHDPRWTEMRVYKTDDGAYVFRRTGHSVMYHRPSCQKIFGRMDLSLVQDSDVDPDWYPCEECLPETDSAPVMLEKAKEYARMANDQRQLVTAVCERDKVTRELTLTKLGKSVLEAAAERDRTIREAIQERMMAAASGQ